MTAETVIGTFADDTAVMAVDEHPNLALFKLQNSLDKISAWLKDWRIKANKTKSIQVTFTTKRESCQLMKLNETQIPQAEEAKYLGLHLDRHLTWKKHIHKA